MDIKQLQSLDSLKSLTVAEVAAKDPDLHGALSGQIAAARQATVLSAFSGASEVLVKQLQTIDYTADAPEGLRGIVVAGLQQVGVGADTGQEAADRLVELDRTDQLRDPAAADLPISANPLFQSQLGLAGVHAIASAAKLPEDAAGQLGEATGAVAAISDERLQGLVEAKALSADQAAAVGVAASVLNLADQRPALAAALSAGKWASLGGGPVARASDTAQLSAEEWQQALKASGEQPPEGLDPAGFAAHLRGVAQSAFLTEALLGAAPAAVPTASKLSSAITAIKPVLAADPTALSKDFANVALPKLTKAQAGKAEDAHATLSTVVGANPAFAIDDVVAGTGSAASKASTIKKRLGLLPTLVANNPDVPLVELDLSPDSSDLEALNFKGISDKERKLALGSLKSVQRTYSLTGDVDDAKTLLAKGFGSAGTIVSHTRESFVSALGIDTDIAHGYYTLAEGVASHVSSATMTIIDVINGAKWGFGTYNVQPSASDFLKQIDGYSDLFGNQTYCNCAECQSILGPAAYFCDLMRWVDDNVTTKYFTGGTATDPLSLKTRRPDLWTLPLTCENTNTMVPYLDLINVILENAIATRRGYKGDLADRAAVEDEVCRELLAAGTGTFVQPFVLPLARLDSYLRYFGRTREEIARRYGAADAVVAAAGLHTSAAGFGLITTPNTGATYLKSLFGVPFTVSGSTIEPFDAQLLLAPTGLSREELGDIVATRWVSPTAPGVTIVAEKTSTVSVQDDIERVHGLGYEALDRMHRFIRTWRGLGWEISEVDLALAELESAGLSTTLDAAAAKVLVDVQALAARWSIPIDQACALWAPIPQVAAGDASQPLFDRLFNLKPFVFEDGVLPKDTVRFTHPALRASGTADPADSTMHRLLAGTQLSSDQLAALITALAGPLGVDLTTNDEKDRGFALTLDNLTLLYRHARLASLLHVSIADLFALIGLAGLPADHVADLAGLRQLLDFADWRTDSSWSIADLEIITGASTPVSPAPEAITAQVVAAVARDRSLQFADTVFGFLPGVTEDDSRAIVAANQALFEPSPDGTGMLLVASFGPATTVTVPAGIAVAPADARDALSRYAVAEVLPVHLSAALGAPSETIAALLELLGVDLTDAALVAAVEGGADAPLVDDVKRLLPLLKLFADEAPDAATIAFVGAHLELFGIADIDHVSVDAVRKLSVYVALTADPDPDFDVEAPPPSPADVQAALVGFDTTSGFAGVGVSVLAAALRADAALVNTLVPTVALPPTAPEALGALSALVALATELRVGGDVLALIVSAEYTDLDHAGQAVLSAIRATFSDDEAFQEAFDPYDDTVRSQRRDALVDALTRTVAPADFATGDDLYEYYLVDTALEGCARTSPLVAAISSVQLYVYRVLMGLEQDRRQPTDPKHTFVPPSAFPADEWTWRQNFRVWQANRKVFLYPESYIEPGLRDDKTPSFSTLEDTLLQTPMDAQSVLDAYGTYLDEFDRIATLRIAGSFHDRHEATKTDVLHLFGVVPGDPPTYYYRTIENAYYGETRPDTGIVYNSWQPINVQIPTDKVSPVVQSGRLFVFWTQVATSPQNSVSEGGSKFVGYRHRLTVHYTMLRLDGSWSAPQEIALSDPGLFSGGDGVVEDPLASQAEKDRLAADMSHFPPDINDLVKTVKAMQIPEFDTRVHPEPLDGYTLTGFQWDRVYPDIGPTGSLTLTGRNFGMRAGVDFYQRVIVPRGTFDIHLATAPTVISARAGWLTTVTHSLRIFEDYAEAAIVSDDRNITKLGQDSERGALKPLFGAVTSPVVVGMLRSDSTVNPINGSLNDTILDAAGDVLLVQKSTRPGNLHLIKRLGTTLGPTLSRTLFAGGVNALLATSTQQSLGEAALPLSSILNADNKGNAGKLDFKGSFGTYYREVFFHIPFLIADALNSQLNYQAADQWYRYIFDPTAQETIALPGGISDADAAKKLRDRVWRYTEFRGLDLPTMRQILTDTAAIEVYKKDPFNPHAIARLRLSAYQKAIVMKYVDNLLDWGDSLFSQFTMESVNEATMLYVTALDILGARPPQLGDCGESAVTPRDYEHIAPLLDTGSEFLAEVETLILTPTVTKPTRPKWVVDLPQVSFHLSKVLATERLKSIYAKAAAIPLVPVPMPHAPGVPVVKAEMEMEMAVAPAGAAAPAAAGAAMAPAAMAAASVFNRGPVEPMGGILTGPISEFVTSSVRTAPDDFGYAFESARTSATATQMDVAATRLESQAAEPSYLAGVSRAGQWKRTVNASWLGGKDKLITNDSPLIPGWHRAEGFHWSITRQLSPAFCVPPNTDLLSYWDRVEDRLYKIRHCQDIDGVSRRLALFAPEIDPRLLVRMQAAGLSLQDVLAATGGDLPPYRFTYLIEKAKQYAATVQSFGAALLSALERKDNEELTLLRATQGQNILQMTTKLREDEIKVADDSLDALERQRDSVQFRHDYYAGLVSSGLSGWETAQSAARYTESGLQAAAGVLDTLAGIAHLIPQLGSPFAMKYGGLELGTSATSWSGVMRDAAKVAEAVSSAAGLQAGFDRRDEGWKFQVDGAALELKQIERQITIAQIRQDIARRSLDIHSKSIEQAQEVFDFYRSRFTNMALQTSLATTLQRTLRDGYNAAYAVANLAAQALRFERGDDVAPPLEASYWDSSRAGLLVGEQLTAALEGLERRYIETNYRDLEIDQPISLSQVAPAALVALRETGACDFEIPELVYDIAYPGQYKRQIKAVRVTVPCVTGPFTNVAATLTLTGSKLRSKPDLGAANLVDVPPRRSVSIATSSAQNDAGIFEFSFRDERYMPFEGSGAISSWRLQLPASFRQFDYQTINDVILHVSYTAQHDDTLREAVEATSHATEGAILTVLEDAGLGRAFSLRQDFSGALNLLLHSAVGTGVTVSITDNHLPFFLRGLSPQVQSAKLALRTDAKTTGVHLDLDGTGVTTFSPDAELGGLPSADVTAAFAAGLLGDHTLKVTAAGQLAPPKMPGDLSALDAAKLSDVVLFVEYAVS